jgi:hypothetical protein
MISIIEQGFLRRNWGKLALGGGALAFAASRGEEMPLSTVKSAGKRIGSAVSDTKVNLPKINKQTVDNAIQTGANKAGAATRQAVDYGKKTATNFQQGYQGSAQSPNLPNTPPAKAPTGQMPPNSRPGQYWNKAFRGQRPNVPNIYSPAPAMA